MCISNIIFFHRLALSFTTNFQSNDHSTCLWGWLLFSQSPIRCSRFVLFSLEYADWLEYVLNRWVQSLWSTLYVCGDSIHCVLMVWHLFNARIWPAYVLGGAGIHTLSITAGGRCQPVMVMVPYFTTNQVVFYPSELPFHRLESWEHHTIHYDCIIHSPAMCNWIQVYAPLL